MRCGAHERRELALLVGIDVGSKRVKAVVVDLPGRELATRPRADDAVGRGRPRGRDGRDGVAADRPHASSPARSTSERDDHGGRRRRHERRRVGGAPRSRTASRPRRSSPGTTNAATSTSWPRSFPTCRPHGRAVRPGGDDLQAARAAPPRRRGPLAQPRRVGGPRPRRRPGRRDEPGRPHRPVRPAHRDVVAGGARLPRRRRLVPAR